MNKYKRLAVNTVVFAIGGFGSKILAFLLTRLYTANLDGADFNVKEVLEMCANILIPVVSFSIADAVIRYGLDKNYEKRAVFSNAVTALIFGAIGFVLLSPLLLFYPDIRLYVPLLAAYVLASCFRQLSAQFARARNYVKLYAADGIFCTFIFFVFNLIFVGLLQMGIPGFMLANILADLVSGFNVWIIAGHGKYCSRKYVDKELLVTMIRFSLPLIPTAILWIITGFADRLFIRHMVSPTDAGVYGAATKIPNLISMVSSIFYQAWNMSAIAENESEERSRFYAQVFEAYEAILVLASGLIIALVRGLSDLLISTSKDAAYSEAYLYTPVLVIAVLMMCFNQFLSSIYTVTKNTNHSFRTSLIAAVLNLVLNAVLIPRFGVAGAIAATFASYFVCYLIRIVDARRFIPFHVSHLRFFLNILVLFFMSDAIRLTDPTKTPGFADKLTAALMLTAGMIVLAWLNFRPLLVTIRKLLKRH